MTCFLAFTIKTLFSALNSQYKSQQMIIVNALNTIKAKYVLPQSGCDISPKESENEGM